MPVSCTYLFNQWRNRRDFRDGGIQGCSIVIRMFRARGGGSTKGDLMLVALVV